MPVAGSYRAIDFALSNMSNSRINKVAVITQYNARSLNEHLSSSKWWDFGRKQGGLFVFTPTITADSSYWYRGTADSLYQNLFCRYRYYHCIQCNQRGAARCGKCKPSTSVRRNCLRHKYSGRFASGWSISHGCCRCRHCHCICTVCLCRLFCRCIKKAGYAYRIFQRTMSDL